MAVSGKTATPHEIPYYLGTDKPPDMAAVTKAIAERTHGQLDAIAPKQIVGPTKKQLLIANASGVVTAVTASGDVTNDESGVFTIGSEKVDTARLKNDAVTAAKIAENAVGSSEIAAGAVAESEIADGAVTLQKLAASAKATIIAPEESRTNVAYGTLTTPDEVKGIVLPTKGLIMVAFQAMWKCSSEANGRAAIFLGPAQTKAAISNNAAPLATAAEANFQNAAGAFAPLASYGSGLISVYSGATYSGDVASGQMIGSSVVFGASGICFIFADAGTYDVSVQYKSALGTITAKNRRLYCWTKDFA